MSAEPERDAVRISPSAAIVLGLLESNGPQTTYDLRAYIEVSIGYFWPFPSSQMYAETKRLEAAGLIAGEQEDGGRRRRQYQITDAGRAALAGWLDEPVDRHTEIRDVGLLKLFIADAVPAVSISALAAAQVSLHRERLDDYVDLASGFGDDAGFAEHTVQLGIAFERVAIDFWEGVLRDAPS